MRACLLEPAYVRKKEKPTYQIQLNSYDESLFKKYGNKSYLADRRYKLSILVDIYNGYYDPELKSNGLASDYSRVLIAYCHFAGFLIPEVSFQFGGSPRLISKNQILKEAEKYEDISESITTLLHGDEELARHPDVCDNIDLLEEYKKNYFEQERTIIDQCLMPYNIFSVSNFIKSLKEDNINIGKKHVSDLYPIKLPRG